MKSRLACLGLLAVSAAGAEVIDVREATNLSVAIHPGGGFLIIDLLEGLWQLPTSGGGASVLLPAGSGAAQPRFDASGERVVFQRWQDGQWDIWLLTLASGVAVPITQTAYDEREPDFAPDTGEIVFASNRSGNYSLWSYDPDAESLRQLTDEPGNARFPTFASDGALAYINRSQDGSRSQIKLYSGRLRGDSLVESERQYEALSWRPGGGVLAVNEHLATSGTRLALYIDADEPVWRRMTEPEDIFVGRTAWLSADEFIYAADGGLWRRGIASQQRERIFLFAGVDVPDLAAEPRQLPSVAADSYPVLGIHGLTRYAPAGRITFSALGDLWVVEGSEIERLTDDGFVDASPQFSADGEWLVFASDRGGTMQLWQLRLASRQMLQLTDEIGRAFAPSVSADGRFVAYVAAGAGAERGDRQIKLMQLDRAFQSRTLATNLYDVDGLNWQGRFVRVEARDSPTEPRYTHVFETAAAEATARSNPAPEALENLAEAPGLRYQAAHADGPFVIQAGRLFDGTAREYRYHVDIHIDGRRITDIVARDVLPQPETVIDATEMTVLPGFIDVHAHHPLPADADTGARWLAHGITTVRDETADWRATLELAEMWESGQLPGPRLIVSPIGDQPDETALTGSPITVGSDFSILASLAHWQLALAERERGMASGGLPWLAAADIESSLRIELSPAGRIYDDVIDQVLASGAYLSTGLGALDASRQTLGYQQLQDAFERVLQNTGRIAIGSDAPAVDVGEGYWGELRRLAELGIANDQILRIATAGGAIALGLSLDLGTIEPGRVADLVIIDGNPLNDLQDLARVRAVIKDGVWYDTDTLAGDR